MTKYKLKKLKKQRRKEIAIEATLCFSLGFIVTAVILNGI